MGFKKEDNNSGCDKGNVKGEKSLFIIKCGYLINLSVIQNKNENLCTYNVIGIFERCYSKWNIFDSSYEKEWHVGFPK